MIYNNKTLHFVNLIMLHLKYMIIKNQFGVFNNFQNYWLFCLWRHKPQMIVTG